MSIRDNPWLLVIWAFSASLVGLVAGVLIGIGLDLWGAGLYWSSVVPFLILAVFLCAYLSATVGLFWRR